MNSAKKFVCPVDKRRFASVAALKQHEADAHAGKKANKGARAPRGKPARATAAVPLALGASLNIRGVSQNTRNGSSRAAGSDVLFQANLKTDVKPIIVARIAVNPAQLLDTRLRQTAELWDRWRPLNMRLSVQSSAPSVAGGQFVVSWTSDHDHRMPADEMARFRAAMAMKPSKIVHLWEKVVITPTAAPQQKWLWVDPQQGADSFYGVFYVILTSPPTTLTGNFGLTITLDWDVVFDTPSLQDVIDEGVIVRADEGYYPYFTTYTSHLPDATRMTLQENSNGGYSSIVRFSEMDTLTVYTPMKAEQLQYYEDAAGKKKKNVSALVRMRETTEPFVWCFGDLESAEAYVSNGDKTKILTCPLAGPWCVGNPDWKLHSEKQEEILYDSRLGYTASQKKNTFNSVRVEDPGVQAFVKVMTKALQAIQSNTRHVGVAPVTGVPVLVMDPVAGAGPSRCGARRHSSSDDGGGSQGGFEKV